VSCCSGRKAVYTVYSDFECDYDDYHKAMHRRGVSDENVNTYIIMLYNIQRVDNALPTCRILCDLLG